MSGAVVGMPQTDAAGLSENWLFKHCGHLHWQRVFRALSASGIDGPELRSGSGDQLYPTFVAVRARYRRPLAAARVDERFAARVRCAHFGRAFFHGRVVLESARNRYALEMLTTFVARERAGRNALHRALPAPWVAYGGRALAEAPRLLEAAQAVRRGEWEDYAFRGERFALPAAAVGAPAGHEPSPYIDFNGAGLLYFASCPTIADTLERRILREAGLGAGGEDWALAASTVARDVFYHRNLDLGGRLVARIWSFRERGPLRVLHTRLADAAGGEPVADLFTAKRIVRGPGAEEGIVEAEEAPAAAP